ncbi:hypothetical protein DSO57_1026626 [Entomophthora muscae]|uniref:Uncharacterized protein n=1 Tax=Entomophthora muscae TaxID=34485 RepID=A0ACC2T221_9FUNG|nr:hypothetical protein DSO57_1026626 [Entomophthora muscae]
MMLFEKYPLVTVLDLVLFGTIIILLCVLLVVKMVYYNFLNNLGKYLRFFLSKYGIDAYQNRLDIKFPFTKEDWDYYMRIGGNWFWETHLKKAIRGKRWGRMLV